MKKFYLGVKLLTLVSLFVIANLSSFTSIAVANTVAGLVFILFALVVFMEYKNVQ